MIGYDELNLIYVVAGTVGTLSHYQDAGWLKTSDNTINWTDHSKYYISVDENVKQATIIVGYGGHSISNVYPVWCIISGKNINVISYGNY